MALIGKDGSDGKEGDDGMAQVLGLRQLGLERFVLPPNLPMPPRKYFRVELDLDNRASEKKFEPSNRYWEALARYGFMDAAVKTQGRQVALILACGDEDEVKKIVEQDPGVQEGLIKILDIRPVDI